MLPRSAGSAAVAATRPSRELRPCSRPTSSRAAEGSQLGRRGGASGLSSAGGAGSTGAAAAGSSTGRRGGSVVGVGRGRRARGRGRGRVGGGWPSRIRGRDDLGGQLAVGGRGAAAGASALGVVGLGLLGVRLLGLGLLSLRLLGLRLLSRGLLGLGLLGLRAPRPWAPRPRAPRPGLLGLRVLGCGLFGLRRRRGRLGRGRLGRRRGSGGRGRERAARRRARLLGVGALLALDGRRRDFVPSAASSAKAVMARPVTASAPTAAMLAVRRATRVLTEARRSRANHTRASRAGGARGPAPRRGAGPTRGRGRVGRRDRGGCDAPAAGGGVLESRPMFTDGPSSRPARDLPQKRELVRAGRQDRAGSAGSIAGRRCAARPGPYGRLARPAPVAQWIEHWSPEPGAQVRFMPGA